MCLLFTQTIADQYCAFLTSSLAMRPCGSSLIDSRDIIGPEKYAGKDLPTDLNDDIPYAFSQFVSFLSALSSSEGIRQYLRPTASKDHPFLDIVTLYLTVFVALQKLNITMNMWTKDQIDKILHHNEEFWTKYLGADALRTHHRLVQKILIINFLAGTDFQRLSKPDDALTYKHRCLGRYIELDTVEGMIEHIEAVHLVPIEPSLELQTTLRSVHSSL